MFSILYLLEPEDDLDAFNDETFGGAAEWEEEAHEELAQLTEQVRSGSFFRLDQLVVQVKSAYSSGLDQALISG